MKSQNRNELYESEEIVIEGDTASEVGYIILGLCVFIVAIYLLFNIIGGRDGSDTVIKVSEDENEVQKKWEEELLSGVLQTEFSQELLKAIGDIQVGDYMNIEFVIEGQETYDDDYIQQYIDHELDKYTRYEEVEKKAESGDVVNIDYMIVLDGQVLGDLTITDYDLKLGSGAFVAGVEDALIGASAGEDVSVEVEFPEDSVSEELAGKRAFVVITINKVQKEIRIELKDENVAYLSSTAKSIEEYIEELKEELEENSYDLGDDTISAQLWNQFIKEFVVADYPTATMDQLTIKKKQVYIQQAESENLTLEYFLKTKDMTEEELDQRLYESAKQEYLEKLAVYYVVAFERLVPNQEKYDQLLRQLLQQAGYANLGDAQAMGYEIEDIEYSILKEIVLDWLTERVKVTGIE